MVDNRGISPVPSFNFKSGDASGMANRMSDEKNGQGGEYFVQEIYEDENFEEENKQYHDRSAQLRASLNGLAAANVGAIHFMKAVKEKEDEAKEENSKKHKQKQEELEEEIEEELLDE